MKMKDLAVALPSISASDPPIYTFKHPYPQRFSLPFDVIKYMIKNCKSPKVWKKIIMSCKYFFPKNPVLPIKDLHIYPGSGCKADRENFDAFKFFPKLWIYGLLNAKCNLDSLIFLIPKMFKFDLCKLDIGYQDLTFNEYQKLTSSGSLKYIGMRFVTINNADGTTVTFDKLLEGLHHLEEFEMHFMDVPFLFKSDTVKKMIQHLNGFKKMRQLKLWGPTESFDFSSFADFLLKNHTVDIELAYFDPVFAEYKEVVENVMKEIKKNPSLKVPYITFWE